MGLLKMYSLLKMGIFHCYVSLPECKSLRPELEKKSKHSWTQRTLPHVAEQNWWENTTLRRSPFHFHPDFSRNPLLQSLGFHPGREIINSQARLLKPYKGVTSFGKTALLGKRVQRFPKVHANEREKIHDAPWSFMRKILKKLCFHAVQKSRRFGLLNQSKSYIMLPMFAHSILCSFTETAKS